MKKAFTLIELLVVIAIIAILAAILFPVFAQAKQAAKKTAALSDVKQVNLGQQMYMGDVDDVFVRNQYNNTGDAEGTMYWTRAVQPYVKNWQMFRSQSELVSPYGIWTPGSPYYWDANWQNWGIGYGMNVEYLNNAGGDCSGWQDDTGFGLPISGTSVAAPSNTVFSTDKKILGNDSGGWFTDTYTLSPGGVYADDACTWSNGGWGSDSYGDSAGLWAGSPGNPTGTGNFAPRYTGGGNVSFVDGSAKYMKPGMLAKGTDWVKGKSNSQIHILDKSQYLWDTAQ